MPHRAGRRQFSCSIATENRKEKKNAVPVRARLRVFLIDSSCLAPTPAVPLAREHRSRARARYRSMYGSAWCRVDQARRAVSRMMCAEPMSEVRTTASRREAELRLVALMRVCLGGCSYELRGAAREAVRGKPARSLSRGKAARCLVGRLRRKRVRVKPGANECVRRLRGARGPL